MGPGYIEKLVVGELVANKATLLDSKISASAISMGGTFLNAAAAQVGDTQLNGLSALDINGIGNFGNVIIDSDNKAITLTDPDSGSTYPGHGGNLKIASQPMYGSVNYEDVPMLRFSNSVLSGALANVSVEAPLVTDRIYVGGSNYGGFYLEGDNTPKLTLGYFLSVGMPAPNQTFYVDMDQEVTEDFSAGSLFFVNDSSGYDAVGIGMTGGGGSNARLRVRANDTNPIGVYGDSITASTSETNIGGKFYASGGAANYGIWADGSEYAAYLEGPLGMLYTNPQIDFNNSDSIRYTDSSAVLDFYNGSAAIFSVDLDGGFAGIGALNAAYKLYVLNSGSSGPDISIYGRNESTETAAMYGVRGSAVGSSSSNRYGLLGSAANSSTSNCGIWADTSGAAGSNIGGYFTNSSTTASSSQYGVKASVSGAGPAVNYGVYSTVSGGTTNWSAYLAAGDVLIADTLNLGAGSALTISSNAITATKSRHTVTASGASDTLNTINGNTSGDILFLRGTNAKTITVADGAGNIQCGTNRTLAGVDDIMLLFYDGTSWQMLGYQQN